MPRITTSITWDMNTLQVLDHRYYEYEGPLALCKGDGVAKDQLTLNNKLVQDQLTRQNGLQDKAINATQGDLTGTNGFSPELMAALISQFQNQNTSNFNSAGSNVRSALAAKGSGTGVLPVGGDYTRGIAELEGAKANTLSAGNLNLGIESLKQAIANKYNAANIMTGTAAQAGGNVGNFNSGANNALNTYVQAANTGFSNAFSTAFGGSLGKGIGSYMTGAGA